MTGFLDGITSGVGELAGTVREATATATETVGNVGRVANLPGYGVLFTVDPQGLRFTKMGQMILGALAAYGVLRMVGGR